jgi:hypothetical protein
MEKPEREYLENKGLDGNAVLKMELKNGSGDVN